MGKQADDQASLQRRECKRCPKRNHAMNQSPKISIPAEDGHGPTITSTYASIPASFFPSHRTNSPFFPLRTGKHEGYQRLPFPARVSLQHGLLIRCDALGRSYYAIIVWAFIHPPVHPSIQSSFLPMTHDSSIHPSSHPSIPSLLLLQDISPTIPPITHHAPIYL